MGTGARSGAAGLIRLESMKWRPIGRLERGVPQVIQREWFFEMMKKLGFSLVAVLVGLVVLVGLGLGGAFWMRSQQQATLFDPIMATVTKGDFVANVLSDG